MAHNLYKGKMVYAGETPWHGLGIKLPGNSTWSQVRDLVGFYDAMERELYVAGIPAPLTDKKALVRDDTGEFLSIVGADYGVVQFNDMAEAVMTACGKEAVFHTAGLLGENGIRGWMLGEIPNPIRVKGYESEIRKYFLATGAHSGGHAQRLLDTATCVVCNNTLTTAIESAGSHSWYIRHTKNAADRVKQAAQSFKGLTEGFEKFGQLANLMAATRLTQKQEQEVIDRVIPLPQDDKKHPGIQADRSRLAELHTTAIGISGVKGTAWGAYMAWTEFIDHNQKALSETTETGRAARMNSLLFGANDKQAALAGILRVAGIKAA